MPPPDVGSVLVVGAGTAGVRAAATLRERGFAGRVVLAGAEDGPPYQRPPLSKQQLLSPSRPLPLRGPAFFDQRDVALLTGDPVVDLGGGRAVLRSGRSVAWDRVVLATGATARPLPVPGGHRARTLRTAADAAALAGALNGGDRTDVARVVVVGGGFLGLEIAAAARTLGHEVAVVEVASHLLARVVSAPCADHVADLHRRHGVALHLDRTVAAITPDADDESGSLVRMDDGRSLAADVVVAAVGAVPDTGLAVAAGLAVDARGVVVDAHLRTSDPRVYAVGDCAAPVVGGRVETVQNADDQARHAVLHLLGEVAEPYAELPWGWTGQFGTTVQTAGSPAEHDRTVVVGDPASGRFSVYCFAGERLCGVESVNAPRDHLAARRMLTSGPSPTPAQLSDPDIPSTRSAA